jgi:hypothetical protein
MTKKAAALPPGARVVPLRKGTTLEMVRLACPDAATRPPLISESFGLPVLDSDGIRDLHEKLIDRHRRSPRRGTWRTRHADPPAAHRRSLCRFRLTAPASSTAGPSPRLATPRPSSANDDRDEDVGRTGRLRQRRPAQARVRRRHGLQAHALRMAAEGAVAAYEQVVGEAWKPFERQVENPGQTVRPQGGRTADGGARLRASRAELRLRQVT